MMPNKNNLKIIIVRKDGLIYSFGFDFLINGKSKGNSREKLKADILKNSARIITFS